MTFLIESSTVFFPHQLTFIYVHVCGYIKWCGSTQLSSVKRLTDFWLDAGCWQKEAPCPISYIIFDHNTEKRSSRSNTEKKWPHSRRYTVLSFPPFLKLLWPYMPIWGSSIFSTNGHIVGNEDNQSTIKWRLSAITKQNTLDSKGELPTIFSRVIINPTLTWNFFLSTVLSF